MNQHHHGHSSRNKAHDFSGLLENPDRITDRDVLYFRREVFRDGVVSRAEADAIFAMDNAVAERCDQWRDFYVEALSEYAVNQQEPRGYVSVPNAEWLVERVSHDGRIDSLSELELLVKVISKAQHSPEMLVRFVLETVARSVIDGEGPLARGRQLTPGVIGEPEVELIRHVLYAFGGEQGLSISRAEADILFDINDRTVEAENHPAWRELFVKAIANHLMAAATYKAPPRTVALAREEWLEEPSQGVGSLLMGAVTGFGQLFSGAILGDIVDSHTQIERAWAERNERMEASEELNAVIEDREAEWLIDRISHDGRMHENEKALLRFIRDESPDIHPSLKPWLEKVA
ncbi:MAG: hypothetical protein R3D32_10805 [Nitratireductor sp.]